MKRESFKSRLGFLLISAGCAIGIGNVWKFPYVAGNYGGGAFVLIYLFFLIAVGVPILTMEFSIGRASRQSTATAYKVLEKPKSKWHIQGYFAMMGNYILMFFYTTVAGWMLAYFYKYIIGEFTGIQGEAVTEAFVALTNSPIEMAIWTGIVIVIGFVVCSFGLQNGVERVTKGMMIALLTLIVGLAIHSFTLDGGLEGIKFYLLPDFSKVVENGVFNTIVAAMNQAFFTLSIGIGSMMIFGSYLSKENSLLGESVSIALLDTFVAIVSGLIIFPACFAFGVSPDVGPSLIFITLPNVFSNMMGGTFWGSLFFLFMSFASLSTIIAVFENILRCCMDTWGWSRKKAVLINLVIVIIGSIPCILGFNLWQGITPFGEGTGILDFEDFIVSNLLLPTGSLVYLLFCVSRFGWGFDKYLEECNTGKGMKMPKWLRGYLTWVLPVVVIIVFVQGILAFFKII